MSSSSQERLLAWNLIQQTEQAIPSFLRVITQSWRIGTLSGTVNIIFRPDVLVHQQVERLQMLWGLESLPYSSLITTTTSQKMSKISHCE